MENGIIGHDRVTDFFEKAVESGKLSHAYCFVGPSLVGKKAVAEFLARKMLKVNNLNASPDFAKVEIEFDEKTEKTKKDITISQIRELREKLSRSSYSGGYKIAIIDEAEKMNLEAANALLKTLEEPKSKTLLFLITNNEKELPRTILSRTQLINFSIVNKKIIQEGLKVLGVSVEESTLYAEMCNGLPGLAISWVNDKEAFVKYQSEIERFEKLFGLNFHDKNKLLGDLFEKKEDIVGAREELQSLLNVWQVALRNLYYTKSNSSTNLIEVNDDICQARILLNLNVNSRMLVEKIMMDIP